MASDSLYLVALPSSFVIAVEVVPANATVLITDWQAQLDPVGRVRALAPELLSRSMYDTADWVITDRVVEVHSVSRLLLEEMASDPDIAAAFENCGAQLLNPAVRDSGVDLNFLSESHWRLPLRQLAVAAGDGRLVANEAIPVLLGMAIVVTVGSGVTYKAQDVFLCEARKADAERLEQGVAVDHT